MFNSPYYNIMISTSYFIGGDGSIQRMKCDGTRYSTHVCTAQSTSFVYRSYSMSTEIITVVSDSAALIKQLKRCVTSLYYLSILSIASPQLGI